MENEVLRISFYNGHLDIFLPKFFPCTKGQFNKLKKIIDTDYAHRDEIYLRIKKFFIEAQLFSIDEIKAKGKAYWEYADKCGKYKEYLASGKNPNGTLLTKQQIKDYKKYKTEYQNLMRDTVKEVKVLTKNKEWFEEQLKNEQ